MSSVFFQYIQFEIEIGSSPKRDLFSIDFLELEFSIFHMGLKF